MPVDEEVNDSPDQSWRSYQRLVIRELGALKEQQATLMGELRESSSKVNAYDARITKLETWRDLMFWAVPFGVTLAGFIIGVLKFAGV